MRARRKYKGIALGIRRDEHGWWFRIRFGRELGLCGLAVLPRDWLDEYVALLIAMRQNDLALTLRREWLATEKRALPQAGVTAEWEALIASVRAGKARARAEGAP